MHNPLLGGRYRRDRELGRGAMGEVWLAHDELLGRPVAVKTVNSSGALTSLATPARDEQLQRIMREARLAARMNHPNAVSVFDLVVEDGQPNVVMEYVEGNTLADEIRASGSLGAQRVAEVGAPVAAALAQAHELDITHRDVKPANILITRRGTPKLADFGVAKVNSDATVTMTGVMLGTPAFVSPEVARGGAADAASDVWSLGATLYAALRGRSPFQEAGGEDALVVLGRLLSRPVPPLEPGPVADVVMRMLDADPARRPTAAAAALLLHDAGRATDTDDRTYVPLLAAVPAAVPTADSSARWSQPTELRALLTSGPVATARPRRGGRPVVLASAAVVLVAAAVAVVLVLTSARGSSSAAAPRTPTPTSTPATSVVTVTAPGATPSATFPAQAGVAVPAADEATTPAEATTSAPDPTADGTETYSAPGNISVAGPSGWSEDDFFQVPTTKEFVAGADHYRDPYLHIGIGTKKPKPDWATEVENSRHFLTTSPKYYDIVVQPAVYVDYRGTSAADIEFTETNTQGIERHAEERIWEEGGVVYIIQLNTPADAWSQYSSVFDDMTTTCSIA